MYEKWKVEIDFHGVAPLNILQFHKANGEVLKESVGNIEKEK